MIWMTNRPCGHGSRAGVQGTLARVRRARAGGGSRREHADAAGRLDLLLCLPREVAGLDDDGLLGHLALAQDLEVARLDHVDDRRLVLVVGVEGARLLGDEGPELVHVDGRAVLPVLDQVEVPHTDLSEVPGVVLVEVDAVVVLASRVPAAAGVLAVLSDAALARGDVAPHVAVLLEARRHRVLKAQAPPNALLCTRIRASLEP